MNLHPIARQIVDVAADEQAIAYVKKETKADGSVFASFYFCDWETLQSRPATEPAYLRLKFGEAGARAADYLGEFFTCRAARLPDGGCAALRSDGNLCLFRPDGSLGAFFPLEYRGAPAYDIAGEGDGLWFTAPGRDAVALFSLRTREISLRVGGAGVFAQPTGLFRHAHNLFVCNAGSGAVKTLQLPAYEVVGTTQFDIPPEKYFAVFRRRFVWMDGALYVIR